MNIESIERMWILHKDEDRNGAKVGSVEEMPGAVRKANL